MGIGGRHERIQSKKEKVFSDMSDTLEGRCKL